MARQGMPDLRELPDEAAAAVYERRRDDDGLLRQLLTDAGSVLMLWGWSALAIVVSAPENRPGAADAVRAFLGLLLWLLGVSLVALVPVARRFPLAAGLGAAAANAVMDRLLRPWN